MSSSCVPGVCSCGAACALVAVWWPVGVIVLFLCSRGWVGRLAVLVHVAGVLVARGCPSPPLLLPPPLPM